MPPIIAYETMQEVQLRIWQAYLDEARHLRETAVENLVENFTNITGATITDLNSLRISLDTFVARSDQPYLLANAANSVLLPTESSWLLQRLGYMTLTPSARQESFDGGLTYVTTVTSLIGPHPINDVTPYDDDSLTGVLGNIRLIQCVFLGITCDEPKSITDSVNKLIKALEVAIGRDTLNVANSITLNKCSRGPNILGDEIYSTSPEVSLVEAYNGISACSAWVAKSETYGITNTDNADDCHIFPVEKALSGCILYLSGQQINEG